LASDITLVVMAAGIGTRYGGLKQIDPVGPNGEIILDYSAYDALAAGFDRIVFIIRRDLERAFRDRIGRAVEKRADVAYVIQELGDLPAGFAVPEGRTKPWGTGHAVLSCRNAVNAPFAVINADDYYGATSFATLAPYLRQARDIDGVGDHCMVGYALENTLSENGSVARGICELTPEGFLSDIRERTRIQRFDEGIRYAETDDRWAPLPPDAIVSLNLWGFTPSILAALESSFASFLRASADRLEKAEYFLPDVVGDLVKCGKARVKVLRTTEKWYGITYQEDRPLVQSAIRDLVRVGTYPDDLWGEQTA